MTNSPTFDQSYTTRLHRPDQTEVLTFRKVRLPGPHRSESCFRDKIQERSTCCSGKAGWCSWYCTRQSCMGAAAGANDQPQLVASEPQKDPIQTFFLAGLPPQSAMISAAPRPARLLLSRPGD